MKLIQALTGVILLAGASFGDYQLLPKTPIIGSNPPLVEANFRGGTSDGEKGKFDSAPQVKWYGVDQLDFRRGIPDELCIVNIQDGNPVTKRPQTQLGPGGKENANAPHTDQSVRVCQAIILDGTNRKAGDKIQVVLNADTERNWASPGSLQPGRYLVVGMKARNGWLPEGEIVSEGTSVVNAKDSNEIYGLLIYPTKAAKISTDSDPIGRTMESLVQALPGSSRTQMERITSVLVQSILPIDNNSSNVGSKTPTGWEKTLYEVAHQSKAPYMRARSLEVLMQHKVQNMEGEFATALMACADDPDAFATRNGYRGLGPSFEQIGSHAIDRGDWDYWTRSPVDRGRATQVALKSKNDRIRYYLIKQVLWAPSPTDWARFVKLLQQPPTPEWPEMLVNKFAFWRGDKPTPKIGYGLVDKVRKITNMPELIDFYTKEYMSSRP